MPLVQLAKLGLAEPRHAKPFTDYPVDKALSNKLVQRIPDRRGANADLVGKAIGFEPHAGEKCPAAQSAAQFAIAALQGLNRAQGTVPIEPWPIRCSDTAWR